MGSNCYTFLRTFGPRVFWWSVHLQIDVTGLPELGKRHVLDIGVNFSTCEEGHFYPHSVGSFTATAFGKNCYSTFSNLHRLVEIESGLVGKVV